MSSTALRVTARPAPQSALYVGSVSHARYRGPQHSFSYKTAMCYLDMGDLPELLHSHPLWSASRWHPVQFRRDDYTGKTSAPLAESVRDLVAATLGERPAGPVRLLAHLRTWGWCFNPLALAFCYDAEAWAPRAVVATVTNTPWGERHDYVLAARDDGTVDTWLDKELHVSPYFPMGQSYHFRVGRPGSTLRVGIDVHQDRQRVFAARLCLVRKSLGHQQMTALALQVPPVTWRVSAGIYWQAACLALKGARFHPHPSKAPN